jgi:hypothetical protein
VDRRALPAPSGVVGCALIDRDVNVTSALRVGGKVKVCNNEWTSFAAFNKVAVLSGSPLVYQI